MSEPLITRRGGVQLCRDKLGTPLSESRLEKDIAAGRGPHPAAMVGKQFLYEPDEFLRYGRSIMRPIPAHCAAA